MSNLTPLTYHTTLALSGEGAMKSLPAQFRNRQLVHVRERQNSDGGFSGRGRGSDLYYSSFALRSAAILGCDDSELWQRSGHYLRVNTGAPSTVVDAFNLLHSVQIVQTHRCDIHLEDRMLSSIRSLLAACQVEGGGFAIEPGTEPSVYQTFLATLACRMIGNFQQGDRATLDFVNACRCADGGYTDRPDLADRAGTNPTSAAVAVLLMHDALAPQAAEDASSFLASMQRHDGGLAAHNGAPVSDLLSTYTGLVALDKLGALRALNLGSVGRFVRAMSAEAGGFHGTACDTDTDLEYTFYGLAALTLLVGFAKRRTMSTSEACCHLSPDRSGERNEAIG